MAVILVGGGSRSDKSRHALTLARACAQPRLFIATAQLLDEEIRLRSRMHQAERGTDFDTVVCDTASRTALAPTEIPVGVITALLGGPFFIWLLRSKRRSLWL